MITLRMSGEKRVLRKLKSLEPKLQRKVLRKAARTAMKPVLKSARNNAPVLTGATRKAIKLRALKRNRRGTIGVKVAIGEQWFQGDEFYASFQEFGWKVGHRKLGPSRKQVEGKHFIERAYDSGGEQAKNRFMSEVLSEINKAVTGGG